MARCCGGFFGCYRMGDSGARSLSATTAARLVWIHGGRTIDPRTAAYFVAQITRGQEEK